MILPAVSQYVLGILQHLIHSTLTCCCLFRAPQVPSTAAAYGPSRVGISCMLECSADRHHLVASPDSVGGSVSGVASGAYVDKEKDRGL